ncbi:MAG TPA: DUF4185 domain-containing protein [Gemmata sp.]|nr:DUF4185 domain-containing protein [Gemmata sp.]
MRMTVLFSLLAAPGLGALAAGAAEPAELVPVPKSTKRICQLTGDTDRVTGKPTLSRTSTRFGVTATDLGGSFEHKGKLYFLFGDTWGRPGDRDVLAWTTSTDPEKITLSFHKDQDGKWLPLTVPDIKQGAFEVPSGGISIDGTIFVAHTTDHSTKKVMGRSVLASSRDDGRTFRLLYELSRDRFVNVSFVSSDVWVYIFGSGEYRKSSVYLARTRPGTLREKSTLRYFSGRDVQGEPIWSVKESDAIALFRHDQVGEFSVAYLPPVKRFVMLYNSTDPRGIMMRSAPTPLGPWSDGTIIFDPWRDNGYAHFMHISSLSKKKGDMLSDINREKEWGGEYGPYIMARYTTGEGNRCRMYFTMSTWNPYQVVVMGCELEVKQAKK